MGQINATPDAYLDSIPNLKLREVAKHLRKLIRATSPTVEERMRYGMLDYPQIGNLAVQKGYVALYLNQEVVASSQELLAAVDANRSCLRFRSVEQIPDGDISELLERAYAYKIEEVAMG